MCGFKDRAMQQHSLLLQTKLEVPPLRARTLARERLLAVLPPAIGTRLLLLSAPAGYGKTTLLAVWCRALLAQCDAAVAWLTLDERDNDPARFLAYLAVSLAQALGLEDVAPIPSDLTTADTIALTQWANALAAADRHVVLVLDDYHVIHAPAIHAAVGFLVEHLPSRVCLAIGSRADPPLPLARLRARGELIELRAADLRFTAEEVQAFLEESNLSLGYAEAASVGAYVEGWPAGVQLVALALRAAPSAWVADGGGAPANLGAGDLLDRLDSSQPFLFTYLAEDVFERQLAHRKAFLLQTAILKHLCGPLCDAVLGVSDDDRQMTNARRLPEHMHRPAPDSYSRLLLEELEHANLFLMPIDGKHHWYRYHHLFQHSCVSASSARRRRLSPSSIVGPAPGMHSSTCSTRRSSMPRPQATKQAPRH
jgi:LuxR family maltose regulon positive regulatory protein